MEFSAANQLAKHSFSGDSHEIKAIVKENYKNTVLLSANLLIWPVFKDETVRIDPLSARPWNGWVHSMRQVGFL